MDAGKLWTAPEILRENNPPRRGTQRGDVYSYAIICYEIMMRTEPYNFDTITPRGRQSDTLKRLEFCTAWHYYGQKLCIVTSLSGVGYARITRLGSVVY